jgi:hypothetical protein
MLARADVLSLLGPALVDGGRSCKESEVEDGDLFPVNTGVPLLLPSCACARETVGSLVSGLRFLCVILAKESNK